MEDVQYVDNGTFVKAFSNDRFSTTVQFFLFLSGEWNGIDNNYTSTNVWHDCIKGRSGVSYLLARTHVDVDLILVLELELELLATVQYSRCMILYPRRQQHEHVATTAIKSINNKGDIICYSVHQKKKKKVAVL